MSLFTKTANDIFAPYDIGGSPREIVPQDAQVWGTEVERSLLAVDGIDQRIYTSLADAEADDIPGEVKRLSTQFRAPLYASPTTLVGGASYRRSSLASLTGYPSATYFRSQDRYLPDGTTDAVNGGYWVIDEGRKLALSMLGALEGSAADAAPIVTAAIQFMFLRGGGEVVADGLYNIQTSVAVPTPPGDPIATQFWTTKVVFRGLGDGTGLRAGTLFPADTVMINMPGPMDIRDMRIDGNGKAGVIGHDLTYITGFARSEFRRIHYIGFSLANSKCFRTSGHTWLFDDCNFERAWAGIWVDNFGINCVISNCNFTANGNSFAQMYFGQNTVEGVPQGVTISGNTTTGGGYGILCRAMYVLNLFGNIIDNTAPGSDNVGVSFFPLATTDVETGLPLQPTCSHLQISSNWIAGGRPIGMEPPLGKSLVIGPWCHKIVVRDNIFPQSAPAYIGGPVAGAPGNAVGGIYQVLIEGNTFEDQQGTNTFSMLHINRVTDVHVRRNIFNYCTWNAGENVNLTWDDQDEPTYPTIVSSSGKIDGWQNWVPVVTTITAGTAPTFGTISGRFRRVGRHIFFSCRIPITNAGGAGTTGIKINNLPAAVATDVVIFGAAVQDITAKIVKLIAASGGGTANVINFDGTNPLVAGAILVINGSYESVIGTT